MEKIHARLAFGDKVLKCMDHRDAMWNNSVLQSFEEAANNLLSAVEHVVEPVVGLLWIYESGAFLGVNGSVLAICAFYRYEVGA